MVFLAGGEVWKIKRDIDFPYMDFSSLEKRRAVCCREVELNRQTAPDLYIGASPICRDSAGHLNLKGKGDPVEWAVRMRRFDQANLLEEIALRGQLSDGLVAALAAHIAEYHRKIPKLHDLDFVSTMRRIAIELTDGFALQPELFPPLDQDKFAELIDRTIAQQCAMLQQRSRAGFVRRCHGDLHLRNIVVLDGSPVLFDALEFDEGFASTDILYDVAFLIMDLWQKGLRHQANLLLNRYLVGIGIDDNIAGLAAMPLFLAIRAGIRAMVSGERAQLVMPDKASGTACEAKLYFNAALKYFAPETPRGIAIGGLSGTGKTALAGAIAHLFGPPPGALHLRSDLERKQLHGVKETQRLEKEAYSQAVTQRVYDSLMSQAARAISAGRAVIVDAVFAELDERQAIERVARKSEVPFYGIWLHAPSHMLFDRVSRRIGDASDADRAVVEQQLAYDTGPVSWAMINSGGSPADVQAAAERLLIEAKWVSLEPGNEKLRQ
jgi:aminoglycoside phosphotransferase family enzyme/predicted kinase